MQLTVEGLACHHTDIVDTLHADVLQEEIADGGTFHIAEKSYVGAVLVARRLHALDNVETSVEHALEGVLGGADGYPRYPLVACVAVVHDVGSEADGVVAHVVALAHSGAQVAQILKRGHLQQLCWGRGLADVTEGILPSHGIVILRRPVFVCTVARHEELALAGPHRRGLCRSLVGKQVVVAPGRGGGGLARHLFQRCQPHEGTAAYAVECRWQRDFLKRGTAHEGIVANLGDTLSDDHLRQAVTQAEGQLAHGDRTGGSVDVDFSGNGDCSRCVLRYAGILSVAYHHGSSVKVNECLGLDVAPVVLQVHFAYNVGCAGRKYKEQSGQQCDDLMVSHSFIFLFSTHNYFFPSKIHFISL